MSHCSLPVALIDSLVDRLAGLGAVETCYFIFWSYEAQPRVQTSWWL